MKDSNTEAKPMFLSILEHCLLASIVLPSSAALFQITFAQSTSKAAAMMCIGAIGNGMAISMLQLSRLQSIAKSAGMGSSKKASFLTVVKNEKRSSE